MTSDQEKSTVWPEFMGALEPDASESSVPASAPADVAVSKPANDLPASVFAWSGEWSGWAGQGRSYDVKLIVESLSPHEATIVCARASDVQGAFSERVLARVHGNELRGVLKNGADIRYRMRNPDVIELLLRELDGRWIAGVLSRPNAEQQQRINERVPTRMVEGGEAISLEMVTFRPGGRGPFPTLVFHHGSTGDGNDPSLFTSTVTSPALARYFNDRGWMVVFPQRRGRGKSGGLYDEGFEPDRSRYSDDPRYALPGFEHALEDAACVVEHLLARTDVDQDRLLIGGHSRGGFLALAFSGARPKLFAGVLNFVGGWVDEHGPASEMINPVIARRGAAFPGPTVWLYAQNDPFYSVAHSRGNFDAFEAAGGQGQFHPLETLPGQDGHHILSLTGLWGPVVDGFLERVGKLNGRPPASN
jgi:pimeloyl-ACP methyl ester carboxylesterase